MLGSYFQFLHKNIIDWIEYFPWIDENQREQNEMPDETDCLQ